MFELEQKVAIKSGRFMNTIVRVVQTSPSVIMVSLSAEHLEPRLPFFPGDLRPLEPNEEGEVGELVRQRQELVEVDRYFLDGIQQARRGNFNTLFTHPKFQAKLAELVLREGFKIDINKDYL